VTGYYATGYYITNNYATSYYATSSYTASYYITTSKAKLLFFLLTLFNLYALYPVAPHLYAQIAYSSPATKLFDGSSLNVALKARHRRRVEADWLGADMSATIAGSAVILSVLLRILLTISSIDSGLFLLEQ
jgi:hypothetical protein